MSASHSQMFDTSDDSASSASVSHRKEWVRALSLDIGLINLAEAVVAVNRVTGAIRIEHLKLSNIFEETGHENVNASKISPDKTQLILTEFMHKNYESVFSNLSDDAETLATILELQPNLNKKMQCMATALRQFFLDLFLWKGNEILPAGAKVPDVVFQSAVHKLDNSLLGGGKSVHQDESEQADNELTDQQIEEATQATLDILEEDEDEVIDLDDEAEAEEAETKTRPLAFKLPSGRTIIKQVKVSKTKSKYKQNKNTAVQRCLALMEEHEGCRPYIKVIEAEKKRDDLSDSILQGIYYLKKYIQKEQEAATKKPRKPRAKKQASEPGEPKPVKSSKKRKADQDAEEPEEEEKPKKKRQKTTGDAAASKPKAKKKQAKTKKPDQGLPPPIMDLDPL